MTFQDLHVVAEFATRLRQVWHKIAGQIFSQWWASSHSTGPSLTKRWLWRGVTRESGDGWIDGQISTFHIILPAKLLHVTGRYYRNRSVRKCQQIDWNGLQCNTAGLPVSHKMSTQCWLNVGPPFSTLAQHSITIGWTSRVCWGARVKVTWKLQIFGTV